MLHSRTPRFLLVFLFVFLASTGQAQNVPDPFGNVESEWVDSVFRSLNFSQRIAQLFMVAAYTNRDASHEADLKRMIRKYKPGGLIFFQGGPGRQIRMTHRLQKISRLPLLIGIDGEWGLGMRLDSCMSFPRQMMLGAIQDDQLIFEMGREIGRQCKALGIHVNFAPVLDVNNNPQNPVINSRSFGENKLNVSRKGYAYMSGLQAERVIATGKHFPGHGDTDSDSHLTLPVLSHTEKHLWENELFPFREIIPRGLTGMLIAHLSVPALDSTGVPTTLSQAVTTKLLQEKLGFPGIIFTDAMNMKGLADNAQPGDADARAILAGNTVLLMSEDVHKGIRAIRKAVRQGKISRSEIDARCLKVLRAKYWAGAHKPTPPPESIPESLSTPEASVLHRKLVAEALTLVRNDQEIIPLMEPEKKKIAAIWVSERPEKEFLQRLNWYAELDTFSFEMSFLLPKDSTKQGQSVDSIRAKLQSYDLVILGLGSNDRRPSRQFGISPEAIALAQAIGNEQELILALFANPYSLGIFPSAPTAKAILVAYENNSDTRDIAAQAIFGGLPLKGHLPVSASPEFPEGCGLSIFNTIRLGAGLPEEAGLSSSILSGIDTIVMEGIREKAFPGCQVLVARKGKVIYEKAFGHTDYSRQVPLTSQHLFDIASVTKIAGTTLGLMKLYDEGLFRPEMDLQAFTGLVLPSDKKHLTCRDVLLHQAGFQAFIPLFPAYFPGGKPDPKLFQAVRSAEFPMRVAEHCYARPIIRDSVIGRILRTPLKADREYLYSDLGMVILGEGIGKRKAPGLHDFLKKEFFSPLGCSNLGYRPLERFPASRVVPTENDSLYRKQVLRADVHDPTAALLGGIAGNAGLFSNAGDLAKLLQMILNGGSYGGRGFIEPETILLFSQKADPRGINRRGLGFDKPELNPKKDSPVCSLASPSSFGHTGFTGTMVWIDPAEQLIYIFLSNRVHPDAANKLLTERNIRTRIQETIYLSRKP